MRSGIQADVVVSARVTFARARATRKAQAPNAVAGKTNWHNRLDLCRTGLGGEKPSRASSASPCSQRALIWTQPLKLRGMLMVAKAVSIICLRRGFM